jgi:hypothetical protein
VNTAWVDRYMTVPFVEKGRTMRGADCLGIVALVLEREARAALTDLGVGWSDGIDAIALRVQEAIATGEFIRLGQGAAAARFDLVQMTNIFPGGQKGELHVGIATGAGMVLHSERPHGPKHQRLDDPALRGRVVAFWRLKALAA